MSKKLKHDAFFKSVFSKPKNAAKLLTLAAENNPSLKELLELINLETLQEVSGEAPREGLSGHSDVAFNVNLTGSNKKAKLLVGIIFEHKSFPDSNIRMQLLKYYYEVVYQKTGNIPTIAIVVYNGKGKWNPNAEKPYPGYPEYFQHIGLPFRMEFIDVGRDIKNLENIDLNLALVIVAMRYAFDAIGQQEAFHKALDAVIESGKFDASILSEIFVYLQKILPKIHKEQIMDSLEVMQNKGYVSIAEADYEEGFRAGEAKGHAAGIAEGRLEGIAEGRLEGIAELEEKLFFAKQEMAKNMLSKGYPLIDVVLISGLSEEEISKL